MLLRCQPIDPSKASLIDRDWPWLLFQNKLIPPQWYRSIPDLKSKASIDKIKKRIKNKDGRAPCLIKRPTVPHPTNPSFSTFKTNDTARNMRYKKNRQKVHRVRTTWQKCSHHENILWVETSPTGVRYSVHMIAVRIYDTWCRSAGRSRSALGPPVTTSWRQPPPRLPRCCCFCRRRRLQARPCTPAAHSPNGV